MLDSEYSKLRSLGHKIPTPRPIAASEVAFGHNNDHLAHVDLEDEAFSSWYRKTAGMHTVRTWCENYQKHPYAWGALIMIHGVDEVSARLRSKVENYAVYSAVLLSASVVLLAMTEMNVRFREVNKSDEIIDMIMARIYLYSLCVSVASHLTSILLSMSFVNSLNEAGRDSDVIRMFGEVRKGRVGRPTTREVIAATRGNQLTQPTDAIVLLFSPPSLPSRAKVSSPPSSVARHFRSG